MLPELDWVLLWVISGWSYSVLPQSGVCRCGDLFRWNGGSARLWLDYQIVMLIIVVILPYSIKFTRLVPLESLVISSGTRIVY